MSLCPQNGDSVPRLSRRLAAIAFADVVGYSILMASDERRTHQRWMDTLDKFIRPQTARHGGTLVKSTGDGVLVSFSSALDAVEWGLDVQRLVSPPAGDVPPSPIVLRIAIHLADVITTDFDVFGDGVNVTARLQEHAPPGGIALSEAVHELVHGSLDIP